MFFCITGRIPRAFAIFFAPDVCYNGHKKGAIALKIRKLLVVLCFLLTACTAPAPEPHPLHGGQTVQQLHLPEAENEPLIGAWVPYFTVAELLSAPDADACRSRISAFLRELRGQGVNAVFVHVCAFGESLYPSEYYPQQALTVPDGLQLFSEECAAAGLSLHAWLNPLRLGTDAEMQTLTDDSRLTALYRDAGTRDASLPLWKGRRYLDPASPETAEFLRGAVTELVNRCHPAGVHIDDYFYPTADPAWDADRFAASGAAELAAWRRNNITALLKTMNAAVHSADPDCIFSVSPQGNFEENYDTLFADVVRWAAEGDCCDLLIPQIYYGYENETRPFTEVFGQWSALPRAENVQLAVGLAAYKAGKEDAYAGSGAREWIEDPEILQQQTADVLADPDLSGVVYYDAAALSGQ